MHYSQYAGSSLSGKAFEIVYSDFPSQGDPDDLQYFERPVSEGDVATLRALYPERNPEPGARIAGTNTVVAGTMLILHSSNSMMNLRSNAASAWTPA